MLRDKEIFLDMFSSESESCKDPKLFFLLTSLSELYIVSFTTAISSALFSQIVMYSVSDSSLKLLSTSVSNGQSVDYQIPISIFLPVPQIFANYSFITRHCC